ncbi:unnamed protein product, partial [Didymodactylos carnosus]
KNNKLTATVVKPDVTVQVKPGTVTPPVNAATQVQQTIATQPKETIAAVQHTTVKTPEAVKQDPTAGQEQPATKVDNTQLIAAEVKPKVNTPTMPEGPIAIKTAEITDKPVEKVYANVPQEDAATTATPAKKRKIRGLGGLINAAVGLVDKREDKIIEFTDTEEGDS